MANDYNIQDQPAGLQFLSGNLSSDHSYHGLVIGSASVVGATLAFADVVILESNDGWVLWQQAAAAAAQGLCVQGVTGPGSTTVLVQGLIRDDSYNLTPGAPLYVTESGLSATAPNGSGDIVQQVGFAVTADIAYVNFIGEYIILA